LKKPTKGNTDMKPTRATTYTDMLPTMPSDTDLEQLEQIAQTTKADATAAKLRIKQLDERIEATKAAAHSDPALAQTIAELTAQEIEHQVRGTAAPKDHAKRLTEARKAASDAELARLEAEALLPALEAMRERLVKESNDLSNAAAKAGSAYGSALFAKRLHQDYAPHMEHLLEIERELAEIESEWGAAYYAQIEFRAPQGGDKFTRRHLAAMETEEA
jgi:chromosome segregation ATPase